MQFIYTSSTEPYINFFEVTITYYMSIGLRICYLYPQLSDKTPPAPKGCLGYNTKLHLVARPLS